MKSPVLLLFPPYTREALSDFEPMGISYIASYILRENPQLDLRLIDFTVEKFSPERWIQELQDFKPKVVGMSVFTLNYPGGRLVAQLTKDFDPTILTVMGGVHATARPEECLEHCDIVVRGEGEISFNEIIQGHELNTIKGISYRKDGNIVHNEGRERLNNLDELPFPAHHLLKMEKYRAFPGWGIMGSRGCPYDCIFCASPQMWGRTVGFRNPVNIVDEVEYLHNEYGIQSIIFFDDTLNVPQQRAIAICDEIIKRDLHKEMSFECQMRANRQLVSPELFQKMKEANFVSIAIGIESGSKKVLQSISKSLTPDEAKQAIEMAREAGINRVKGFFMVGNWDEGIGDILKTWQFVLSNDVQPAFSVCTPFPGTAFYSLVTEKGYMKNTVDWNSLNQVTPIVRTNKMPKPFIFVVYVFSVMLQFLLSFSRGDAKHTGFRIVDYAWDMVKTFLRRMMGRILNWYSNS